MYREVGHDRPEELASGNMCGIRPRRMVCLVMAIPKQNNKGFVGYGGDFEETKPTC